MRERNLDQTMRRQVFGPAPARLNTHSRFCIPGMLVQTVFLVQCSFAPAPTRLNTHARRFVSWFKLWSPGTWYLVYGIV